MEKKVNVPKKGAAKKWAQKLREIGQQPPSKELMEILNKVEKPKKVALPRSKNKDLDV